jgi:Protein of unknown function (DUF4232)/Galactose oxidase, central domain
MYTVFRADGRSGTRTRRRGPGAYLRPEINDNAAANRDRAMDAGLLVPNEPGNRGLMMVLRLLFGLFVLAIVATIPPVPAARAEGCHFVFGFATLHDLIPEIVGQCLEDEQHNPTNGDGLQATTLGLLVWRKADNFTAFTDGFRTWINGPSGVQERLNSQRFTWEENPQDLLVVPIAPPGERCHTAGLSLRTQGAIGDDWTRAAMFVFTNRLAVPCTLQGYAAIRLLDAQGNPIPTQVTPGEAYPVPDPGPSLVRLPPGGSATFGLTWEENPPILPSCPRASQLAVIPPGESVPIPVPIQVAPCQGGTLRATAIQTASPGMAWVQQHPATVPSVRYDASLADDPASGTVVLFGGCCEGLTSAVGNCCNRNLTLLGDTWTWDGSAWTKQSPLTSPPPRSGAAMVYDAATHTVVLFGGNGAGGTLNDTWIWDGRAWSERQPAARPPGRAYTGMVDDSKHREVVLFGGAACCSANRGSIELNDTWVWDGATWTQRHPATAPAERANFVMAYDSTRQQTILLGGLIQGGSASSMDTWAWDGAEWHPLDPTTVPQSRVFSVLADDPALRRLVLFGGYWGVGRMNDTWTWDGGTWVQVPLGTTPPARGYAAMAFDSTHQKIVLFGGAGTDCNVLCGPLDDTWTLDVVTTP